MKNCFRIVIGCEILFLDFDNEVRERKVDRKGKIRLSAKLISNARKKGRDYPSRCPASSRSTGSKIKLTR